MHTKYLFPNQPLLSEMLPLVNHSFHWGIFSLQYTHTSGKSSLNLFIFLKICLNIAYYFIESLPNARPLGLWEVEVKGRGQQMGMVFKDLLTKNEREFSRPLSSWTPLTFTTRLTTGWWAPPGGKKKTEKCPVERESKVGLTLRL